MKTGKRLIRVAGSQLFERWIRGSEVNAVTPLLTIPAHDFTYIRSTQTHVHPSWRPFIESFTCTHTSIHLVHTHNLFLWRILRYQLYGYLFIATKCNLLWHTWDLLLYELCNYVHVFVTSASRTAEWECDSCWLHGLIVRAAWDSMYKNAV